MKKPKLAAGAARALFLAPVAALAVTITVPMVEAVRTPETEVREVNHPVIYEADELMVRRERPFTAEDEIMLAKLLYTEARGVTGEKWGVSGQARQAAVVWTVLNRVDDGSWGDTIAEVVTYPYQFAWDPDAPVEIGLMDLAYDVLCRWEAEKNGEATVGRVLPRDYLYFGAEGGENYFRREYEALGDNWDWRLPDPYQNW